MQITEPGVYDVPEDIYHSWPGPTPTPCLHASGAAVLVKECPAIFLEKVQNPKPASAMVEKSKAAHTWFLEGEDWADRYYIAPDDYDGRTKAGKKIKAEADASNRVLLKQKDFNDIKRMKGVLDADPLASNAFVNGRPERSLYWFDEEFGVWCCARPDWLPATGDLFPDLKAMASVNPDDLERDLYNYGWFQRAAWYHRGIKALGLSDRPQYLFICQMKEAPYIITPFVCDREDLAWGDILNHKALQVFAECVKANDWPPFTREVETLSLVGWARARLQREHEMGKYTLMSDIVQRPEG